LLSLPEIFNINSAVIGLYSGFLANIVMPEPGWQNIVAGNNKIILRGWYEDIFWFCSQYRHAGTRLAKYCRR